MSGNQGEINGSHRSVCPHLLPLLANLCHCLNLKACLDRRALKAGQLSLHHLIRRLLCPHKQVCTSHPEPDRHPRSSNHHTSELQHLLVSTIPTLSPASPPSIPLRSISTPHQWIAWTHILATCQIALETEAIRRPRARTEVQIRMVQPMDTLLRTPRRAMCPTSCQSQFRHTHSRQVDLP